MGLEDGVSYVSKGRNYAGGWWNFRGMMKIDSNCRFILQICRGFILLPKSKIIPPNGSCAQAAEGITVTDQCRHLFRVKASASARPLDWTRGIRNVSIGERHRDDSPLNCFAESSEYFTHEDVCVGSAHFSILGGKGPPRGGVYRTPHRGRCMAPPHHSPKGEKSPPRTFSGGIIFDFQIYKRDGVFLRFGLLQWALLHSASSLCYCTFCSNFCVVMTEQLCSNPWHTNFVKGKFWDHPSKLTQKWPKLGSGVIIWYQ